MKRNRIFPARHRLVCASLLAALLPLGCWIEVERDDPDEVDWDFEDSEAGGHFPGDLEGPGLDTAEPGEGLAPNPPPPSDDPDDPRALPTLPSDMYRDLIVLDPAVVGGPLAANDNADAPFSFRAQMQWLAGAGRDALDFTTTWLERWERSNLVGPELAPVTPRPGVRSLLLEPWLAASGAAIGASDNGYATADGGAAPRPRSWEDAPFRLIAIVNRVDLASDPCSGFAGELRYVYSATNVSGEAPIDATLILEIPYPTTRPAADWAAAWSELANLSGAAYAEQLARLALEVQREADPLRVRLRSNEIALSNPAAPSWELREFRLAIEQSQLELILAPLEFTPRADADPALIAEHVLAHADEVRAGSVSLPPELQAGAAEIGSPGFSWPVLGVSEGLRQAFSAQTCNGCHGGDAPALPFRHVAPNTSFASAALISKFLYDPGAPSDELRRRRRVLADLSLSVSACPNSAPIPGLYPEP